MIRARTSISVLAAAVALGGLQSTALAGTTAHTLKAPASALSPDPSRCGNELAAVSAVSASDAWAVGAYLNHCPNLNRYATLILHWNGKSWARVPSPSAKVTSFQSNHLLSVSAASATDAWAVGIGLALHWNGKTWSRVAIPGGSGDVLASVSDLSASDAWAVGVTSHGNTTDSLALHWNGKAWSRVPSPDPGSSALQAVSAVSARNVWAVGSNSNKKGANSFTTHWNGKAWSKVPAPDPLCFPEATPPFTNVSLEGVSARRGTGVWAVGFYETSDCFALDTMTLQWTGTAWSQVASPSPSGDPGDSRLHAVGASSASDVWAVGSYVNNSTSQAPTQTLALHWDGTAWSQVPSPNPANGNENILAGVSAVSPSDAWAVGSYLNTKVGGDDTLILHWNGKAWTIA